MPVSARRPSARTRPRSFADDQPTLLQFVLLSMLLHVLLIVLFGNPSGGSARGKEQWWGPLDVRLWPVPRTGTGDGLVPSLQPPAPGARAPRRARAAPETPAPSTEEEAAPVPPEIALPQGEERVPEPAASAPSESAPPLAVPEEGGPPLVVPAVEPAKIERVAPPSSHELAAPIQMPARVAPIEPAAPIERVPAQPTERRLGRAVEIPRAARPAAPAPPIERAVPRPVERQLARPAELPAPAAPSAPAPALERLAPPQTPRALSPAELPRPVTPPAPATPLDRVAPPRTERAIAPPVALPALRTAPAPATSQPIPAAPAATTPAPSLESRERAAPAGTARPQAPPAAPPRSGAPSPEEEIFKPRSEGGAPAEGPRIDLDAARKKAVREIASEGRGSRGVFTSPAPPPLERKSKEAMAMEKAIKPDCRTAYANLGLLAVPVLVANAIAADGSCRW